MDSSVNTTTSQKESRMSVDELVQSKAPVQSPCSRDEPWKIFQATKSDLKIVRMPVKEIAKLRQRGLSTDWIYLSTQWDCFESEAGYAEHPFPTALNIL